MQTTIVQDLITKDLWADNSWLPDNIQSEETRYAGNPAPRRFWEIEDFFKCPVIGTCLDMSEQKRLLKKENISSKKKSAIEIHEILVGSSKNENSLSRRIDSWLNRKFKKEVTEFSRLEQGDFIQLWKSRFKDGGIEGLLWIAATRPDLSKETRRSVFGDIHMEMHLNACRDRKLRRQFSYQQEENQKLTQRLRETGSMRRTLQKENKKLTEEISDLRGRSASLEKAGLGLEKELSELRSNTGIYDLEASNQRLQEELNKLSGGIESYRQQLETLRDQNGKLLSELERQHEMNGHLREEMARNITRISDLNRCDETCPSFDLCRKRILIVGGINRMESLYRQLIEENGGVFEYHDGHMNGGIKVLETRVRRADVVLCPVNINSHYACLAVKKMGKKHGKSVQMLAGSGLGVISQALLEYQKGVSIQ